MSHDTTAQQEHEHGKCGHDHSHEELQQDYLKLQLLSQQIGQTQKQLQSIEEHCEELNRVMQSLEDLKITNTGSEILVPLSSGIFVKAELKDNQEVTVNVGSGVTVRKTIDETKALVSEQLDELAKVSHTLVADFQKMGLQARMLQEKIESHSCD